MKEMRGLLAFSVLLLSTPVVQADDWDAYNQWWLSQYYSLDPKAFTSISCDVESSLLEDGTKTLLASHPSLTAEPGLYKLSVDNTGRIHISDPALQLVATDPSRAAEVPLVTEMIQSKYQLLETTIDHDIKGVINNYTPPDRTKSVIEKFTLDKEGDAFITRKDLDIDSTSVVTVHGPELSAQTTQTAMIGTMVVHAQGMVKMHFDMADGKYLPTSQEQDGEQVVGANKLHSLVKMSIDYQSISGIRFPKSADFINEPGSDTSGFDEDLEFKDCKVTK